MVHINTSQNGTASPPSAPMLEFVVHNSLGEYDKAADGERTFTCQFPFECSA